jgi:hypothetical protein
MPLQDHDLPPQVLIGWKQKRTALRTGAYAAICIPYFGGCPEGAGGRPGKMQKYQPLGQPVRTWPWFFFSGFINLEIDSPSQGMAGTGFLR